MKKLILKISINNDFVNNFDHGIVELTPGLCHRIKQLAQAAADLDVTRISEFDYSVKTMISDYDAEESDNGKQPLKEPENGRVECPFLVVETDCFCWEGLVGASDIRWGMDNIPLSVLGEPGDYDQRDSFDAADEREALTDNETEEVSP